MTEPTKDPQIKVHDDAHAKADTQPNLLKSYSGPSVHDMISSHTVAENIIKYNSQMLDTQNMELLRRFVNDPGSRDQILEEIGLDRVEGVTGQYHGDMAGYIVLRHRTEVGETVEPVLTNDEIDALKEWFQNGQREPRGGQEGDLNDGDSGHHEHHENHDNNEYHEHHEHHRHSGHHRHHLHRERNSDDSGENGPVERKIG